MNVKHSKLFGLLRRRECDVNHGHSRAANMMWHNTVRGVKRTPQQMTLCPFKHFPNCGGRHLRCSCSCHSLSPPLTFGILGCMPCTDTGSGMATEDILSEKGTCTRDKDICCCSCFCCCFVLFYNTLYYARVLAVVCILWDSITVVSSDRFQFTHVYVVSSTYTGVKHSVPLMTFF